MAAGGRRWGIAPVLALALLFMGWPPPVYACSGQINRNDAVAVVAAGWIEAIAFRPDLAGGGYYHTLYASEDGHGNGTSHCDFWHSGTIVLGPNRDVWQGCS